MPVHALLLAAGLWAWLVGSLPGADEGRAGNRRYADGQVAEAGTRYSAGLLRLEEATAPSDPDRADLSGRLGHNLGLALYDQEEYAGAADAYTLAAGLANDPLVAAAGHYGAGLAAARQEEYDAALEHFAQALRVRPDFPEAAYNWEWVRRQMPDQPPPDQDDEQPPPPEPTPFAEQLKAQADELVAQRRYREAQELMLDGLEQDSTVGAYADFTERLGAVADIDEL